MRAWAEDKSIAKAEIARISAKTSEMAKIKDKVRLRDRDDGANINIEEAGAPIRVREEAKT